MARDVGERCLHTTISCQSRNYVLYLFSTRANGDRALSEPVEPLRQPSAAIARLRRETRRGEGRPSARGGVVGLLNRGVSIAEIASPEGVTERGMRKYVRSASRTPRAPAARRVSGAAGEPPQRGVARRLQRDVGRQPSRGRPGRDNRARTRPLSRFRFRRRARDANAVPPRAAFRRPRSRSKRCAPGRNRMAPQMIETAPLARRNGDPLSSLAGEGGAKRRMRGSARASAP